MLSTIDCLIDPLFGSQLQTTIKEASWQQHIEEVLKSALKQSLGMEYTGSLQDFDPVKSLKLNNCNAVQTCTMYAVLLQVEAEHGPEDEKGPSE